MDNTIVVNRLPVPTWNRLAVNAAAFPVSAEETGSPAELTEAFAAIPTGMGEEAEARALQTATHVRLVTAEPGEEKHEAFAYCLRGGEAVSDITLIHAKKGSRVTVLQSYESADEAAAVHTGLTKIIAEEDAEVTLIQAQLMNDATEHFSDIGAKTDAGAKFRLIQAELGGKAAMTGAQTTLEGARSEFESDTVYFGDGARRIDLNYIAKHLGRKTKSSMKAAGALLGESDKVYRGTIDFVSGCAKSAGREAEETLLFSDGARNRTVPLILCDEEDVDGQHAASIGRINAARMFYLQSRGLTEAEVRKLAVDAQFAPVIAAIPDEALQSRVGDYLERRLQLD